MIEVHLIDGTYELFRAYYGAPAATSPAGREVGAVRGLLRSLIALLRRDDVTHVACAFDHVIESFRNRLFSGYKTGDGVDPALRGQFALAERATRALGVTAWPMVEFEADDALATAARALDRDRGVGRVLVCSPDKDLAQCVRKARVILFDRMRDRALDEAGVIAKFGVPPRSIPDYLALVGDRADGIPGLPRWGAKTAATMLARYGRLEEIPDDAAAWEVAVRGGPKLAAILRDGRRDAMLYRELATLRTDVDLGAGAGDIHVDALRWRGADGDALETICEELGEARIAARVPRPRPG